MRDVQLALNQHPGTAEPFSPRPIEAPSKPSDAHSQGDVEAWRGSRWPRRNLHRQERDHAAGSGGGFRGPEMTRGSS